MAFEGAMKMMGKRASKVEEKRPENKMGGANESGAKTHTIEEHPDGHFESHMHDGTHTEHPDHLHLMAHLGHHLTGGDKHHVVHHDGMGMMSHGIHGSGEHDGTHDHANLDELHDSMDKFLDEEGQEGEPKVGGEDAEAQGASLSGY